MQSSNDPTKRSRLLLVDDHPIVRTGIAGLLRNSPDLEVCGVAHDYDTAMHQVETLRPDLVLLDRTLGEEHGLDPLKDIKARWPDQRVLVLSMHDETLFAPRALSLGASGYVMKDEAPVTLLVAIRKVLAGEIYLSERMANKLLRRSLNKRSAGRSLDPLDGLTARELQVFELIGQGKSTAVIAAELGVGPKTVETFRGLLKQKLNLASGLELVRYAVESRGDRNTDSERPPRAEGHAQ